MSTEIHSKHLRCASADCGRIFPESHATIHRNGGWSEAFGVREYHRTVMLCCPYCAGETDEIELCGSCHEAEAEEGCSACTDCIALEDADWKERKARYDANEPDCERARKALVTA